MSGWCSSAGIGFLVGSAGTGLSARLLILSGGRGGGGRRHRKPGRGTLASIGRVCFFGGHFHPLDPRDPVSSDLHMLYHKHVLEVNIDVGDSELQLHSQEHVLLDKSELYGGSGETPSSSFAGRQISCQC
jgi:hypothetical protein